MDDNTGFYILEPFFYFGLIHFSYWIGRFLIVDSWRTENQDSWKPLVESIGKILILGTGIILYKLLYPSEELKELKRRSNL